MPKYYATGLRPAAPSWAGGSFRALRALKRKASCRINGLRYHGWVIRSFRDKDTERLFDRQPARKLGADVQRVALRRLRQIDAAVSLDDLRSPPGNRLEKLRGDRAGQHSRVNDQWRVFFRWAEGDAYEVEIVDYHR